MRRAGVQLRLEGQQSPFPEPPAPRAQLKRGSIDRIPQSHLAMVQGMTGGRSRPGTRIRHTICRHTRARVVAGCCRMQAPPPGYPPDTSRRTLATRSARSCRMQRLPDTRPLPCRITPRAHNIVAGYRHQVRVGLVSFRGQCSGGQGASGAPWNVRSHSPGITANKPARVTKTRNSFPPKCGALLQHVLFSIPAAPAVPPLLAMIVSMCRI